MEAKANTIVIDLNRKDEIFGIPQADPFDPDSRYISGIDEIVERLKLQSHHQRREQHIVITLPQAQREDRLEEKIRAALIRYCDAKVDENQQALNKVKRKAPRALLYSLVIVSIGLTLGGLALNANFLLETLQILISNGLTIFAWVALWEPAGIYLYEWLPIVREKRLYRLLKTLDLSLQFRA